MALLHTTGLPTDLTAFPELAHRYDVDAIWNIMQSDKKKKDGKVRFVLIRKPGDCFVSNDVDEVLAKKSLRSLE